jgi:hypothetical protein
MTRIHSARAQGAGGGGTTPNAMPAPSSSADVPHAEFRPGTGAHVGSFRQVQGSPLPATTEAQPMRIAKQDIPARINVPGAVARQQTNFGDATGYGMISGEYFSLAAGTDISPLLQGLEGDLCQAPHWGYVLQGELTVTYADGSHEVISGGDLFYWPPGHTVKVGQDAEVILFSPQHEHSEVIDHMLQKMSV